MEIIRQLQEKYSQDSDNGIDDDSDCLEERYHELCQKYNLLLEENEHLRINMDVYQVIKSSRNIFGLHFIFDWVRRSKWVFSAEVTRFWKPL